MTNFDYVQKTIDLFEESLDSGVPFTTAGALADKIGYSAHHLGRLFQSLCGEPLGRYMLKRRLCEALTSMRDGGMSASAAAFHLGWEDYSAFSRAFKKEFGISPSRVGDSVELTLTGRARPALRGEGMGSSLEPRLERVGAFHVTGLVFFMDQTVKTFHRPWRLYQKLEKRISGRIGRDSWQFSAWSDEAGQDEGLWILCAARTAPDATQEPVFHSRMIPATDILRFVHDGPIEYLYHTYRRIWEDFLPQSSFRLKGCEEYQYYPASDPGRIHICLPVEKIG